MKTADPAVESSLKQTSKLVNKKQLELDSDSFDNPDDSTLTQQLWLNLFESELSQRFWLKSYLWFIIVYSM